jgi:hypothetical protein
VEIPDSFPILEEMVSFLFVVQCWLYVCQNSSHYIEVYFFPEIFFSIGLFCIFMIMCFLFTFDSVCVLLHFHMLNHP